ncbi:CG14223 [Drosophila busckii]|uniref:CG14223 n=1 Tax=Drosophila busckii TaxID=30019 RepID=A0A0M5J692_DROBS|nr:CG14223 [Drosophila busckii]
MSVSLLLALLSLIFLLKISPNSREDALTRSISSEDFIIVYDVTLALCALSLSLNLCCLLVCAIQFLFAVKLLRSPMFDGRDNKYLEKSSASRTCAVSGFFISIPVFLTGIILYTFNHFHSTPAIITSVLIGVGIVFCGGAMVHNVFVWQKEKTISYRSPAVPLNMSLLSAASPLPPPPPPPPVQFISGPGYATAHNQSLLPVQLYAQQSQGHNMLPHHPTSVTPVSPNHSHGSFNPLLCAAASVGTNNNMSSAAINSSFLVRPATATPPTPKPIGLTANGNCLLGREASGSISPGIPPTLDMSNITNISLHELSTLV